MNAKPETTRDPVCGMEVRAADAPASAEWRGLTYSFCSEQCRERFVAAPALYIQAVRIADVEPIPKRRRLRFVSPGAESLRAACGVLLGMMGVRSAIPDGDAIVTQYDLRQATLAQLERTCAGSGLVLRGGLHGWRRALWRFEEDNEIGNAARPAGGACCNRPPARVR